LSADSGTIKKPLTTTKANILARTLLATTRQAIELESYPNHSRIQQVFGSKSKKTLFVFGLGFLGGPLQVGVFWLFLATFTWPWTPTHWAIILAQDFLETRPKSASLEPLNDFAPYL